MLIVNSLGIGSSTFCCVYLFTAQESSTAVIYFAHNILSLGISLVVQWLRFHTSTAESLDLIPDLQINQLINFWLCWVFIAVHGLSPVVASRPPLHCGAWASDCGGFSRGAQALGPWTQ